MYLLERIEKDTERLILAAPERKTVELLLSLILRARIRSSSNEVSSEHLRSAEYRLKAGHLFDEFIALDGEHFRICKSDDSYETPYRALAPSKRTLRRLAAQVPPPRASAVEQSSSVQTAVARSKEQDKSDIDWYAGNTDEDVLIDGDRFGI